MKKTPLHALPAMIAISGFLAMAMIQAKASYAIYVGKNLTTDGRVFIGGSGDEVSSHWLEIVPAKRHADGTTINEWWDERTDG